MLERANSAEERGLEHASAAGARGSRCAVGPVWMTVGSYALEASGPVTVVEVGTTTTVTLWTDDTGDTTGPNPVSPDGSGWVQIHATAGDVDLLIAQGDTVERVTVTIPA